MKAKTVLGTCLGLFLSALLLSQTAAATDFGITAGPTVSSITASSATIGWSLTSAATGQVQYEHHDRVRQSVHSRIELSVQHAQPNNLELGAGDDLSLPRGFYERQRRCGLAGCNFYNRFAEFGTEYHDRTDSVRHNGIIGDC